jgi:predicted short-subunit dehydrogenase-like oxidoreductase (DUF2520 family)
MAEGRTLSVLGPGRVGTALAILASRGGWDVAAVGARRAEAADEAARRIGPGVQAHTLAQAAGAADVVLLTVSDDAIAPVACSLAGDVRPRPGAVLLHCSGALGSDVLAPAREAGFAIGSMHPLQTFPTVESAVASLPDTWVFCEGQPAAVAAAECLARSIGARHHRIDPGAKALYHAAAVTACNSLSALMDAALALAEAAGIDRADGWEAMRPLVSATLANIDRLTPAGALTGPVARGDVETIRRHVSALSSMPADLDRLYRAAGRWTVDLARRKGTLRADQVVALTREFTRPDSEER